MRTIKKIFRKIIHLILIAVGYTTAIFSLCYFLLYVAVEYNTHLRMLKETIKSLALGLFIQ